jgi:hypothetical protein
MSALISFAREAVIGGLATAPCVIALAILVGVAGRERGSHRRASRLDEQLAAADLEIAMARAQAKSISDEGGDREPA